MIATFDAEGNYQGVNCPINIDMYHSKLRTKIVNHTFFFEYVLQGIYICFLVTNIVLILSSGVILSVISKTLLPSISFHLSLSKGKIINVYLLPCNKYGTHSIKCGDLVNYIKDPITFNKLSPFVFEREDNK